MTKTPTKKKTFVFECYNSMDPMEFFEVHVHQGNSKILQLLCQVLILWILEKMVFPSMSKTAKFGNKIQGILGIKN